MERRDDLRHFTGYLFKNFIAFPFRRREEYPARLLLNSLGFHTPILSREFQAERSRLEILARQHG
jgi:hypothetical protein